MLLARRYFNGPLDGLIYGALIGGGFAFTENIIYYSRQLESFGVGGMVVLVIIRGVLNIFGHAIYTSMTGVLMALVARSEEHTSELQSRGHLVCRLLLA